ncbi:two-component sensor histidine kinase [Clostridia bacterium]|nr:two-component sensor histidine kinase [Clostridia bacterium]
MKHRDSYIGNIYKNSMIFRIVYLMIAISILVLLLTTSYIISSYSDMLYEKERQAGQIAAENFYSFVSDKYYYVFDVNNQIYSRYSGIEQTLLTISRDNNSSYTTGVSSVFSTFAHSYALRDDDVWDFFVIADSGVAYHYTQYAAEHSVLQSFPYLEYDRIQKFYNSDKLTSVYYDSAPEYNTRNRAPVISFAGKIVQLSQPGKKIGMYILNYRYSTFEKYYLQQKDDFNGKLIIYDRDHQILYSSEQMDVGGNIDDIFANSDKNAIIIDRQIGLSDLSVTCIVSEELLLEKIDDLKRSQFTLIAISVIVSLCIATILFQYYNRRVNKLVDVLLQSDLSIRAPVDSKDEIGLISSAYNELCDQMLSWIDRQYNTQIQLRSAELYALTSQINPHFIYNTLESIRMQALIDGNEKVSEMLILFSNMFRWTMELNANFVRLEDELEYISSYLHLQNTRLSESIDICLEVDDSFLDLGIPKLILQPIVENSIIYGKWQNRTNAKIRIAISRSANDLRIEVKDNGCGISAEKLNLIKDTLNDTLVNQDTDSIGLKNVHSRLRLIFGDGYGLTIESRENIGTCVCVCIPLMTLEEMIHHV